MAEEGTCRLKCTEEPRILARQPCHYVAVDMISIVQHLFLDLLRPSSQDTSCILRVRQQCTDIGCSNKSNWISAYINSTNRHEQTSRNHRIE